MFVYYPKKNRVCRVCKATKPCERAEKRPRSDRHYYRAPDGRAWAGKVCPDCSPAYQLSCPAYQRTKHWKPYQPKDIDDSTYPPTKKGRDAEHLVRRFFEAIGFEVEITRAHGPDLLLKQDGKTVLTCEVKSAILNKPCGRYFSAHVTPARRGDDLIAIVCPDQSILIEDMAEFLKTADKVGRKYLPKEYGYIPLEKRKGMFKGRTKK